MHARPAERTSSRTVASQMANLNRVQKEWVPPSAPSSSLHVLCACGPLTGAPPRGATTGAGPPCVMKYALGSWPLAVTGWLPPYTLARLLCWLLCWLPWLPPLIRWACSGECWEGAAYCCRRYCCCGDGPAMAAGCAELLLRQRTDTCGRVRAGHQHSSMA